MGGEKEDGWVVCLETHRPELGANRHPDTEKREKLSELGGRRVGSGVGGEIVDSK